MIIKDFKQTTHANNDSAIEAAMAKRYEVGVNSFWLTNGNSEYPALLVLVNQNSASAHYFPEADHPGFQSEGSQSALEPRGTQAFYLDGQPEPQLIVNEAIIGFDDAIIAAKEFAKTGKRPSALNWIDLSG